MAELEHLKHPLIERRGQKVNKPTYHAPKILVRSFISIYVVLRYGRSEKINGIDAEKEHTLMKRITSAIIGYLGAKRTVQRATAVFKEDQFFNLADRHKCSHLHIQVFRLPRLKQYQPRLKANRTTSIA